MCVAAIAWDCHPRWLLVAVGNRDEFHARASAPLGRWDDKPGLVAGRDLVGGGTWLGVHEAQGASPGRFALVTNFRVPQGPQPGRPSRGQLVTDLLEGLPPQGTSAMNPFNLVHVEGDRAWFLGNYPEARHEPLMPGLHGLSNGGFEDRWPKTRELAAALSGWLEAEADESADNFAPLFAAMRREVPPPADVDAVSGPAPAHAAVFIADPVYGTRCSTVVAVDRAGHGVIVERRFDAEARDTGESREMFRWSPVEALA